MAKKSIPTLSVTTLTHGEATRKNVPTAECQSVMKQDEQAPVRIAYARGAGLDEEKAQRNRDLDPQLVWRGKDQQDWSDLVVNAPPLYIQEKIHPKVLIDDLLRRSAADRQGEEQIDLFADFNGLPGQVQCIYFDPPYGVKFNSNFQWSTKSASPAPSPTSLAPWPGDLICAEGRYDEGGTEKRAGIFIGPEFGTVNKPDLVEAARECAEAGFDVLVACAFNYDVHSSDFSKLGRIPVLKARMNADLHMAEDFKNTGKGNLFVIFGEPDIDILEVEGGQARVKVNGVDVFHPNTGEVRSDGPEGIACWFIDTDYNMESFFVRQAYFLGANDPYKALKTTLKAEINEEARATLHSDTSRPFDKPKSGRIAVKVINHLGDEVMKVFKLA